MHTYNMRDIVIIIIVVVHTRFCQPCGPSGGRSCGAAG